MQKETCVTFPQVALVVDASLNMSIGKTAAQCAHAAVGLVKCMHANRVP